MPNHYEWLLKYWETNGITDKKTRLLLMEATHFVLYPQSTSAHAMTYLLKTHIGLDKDEISRLRKSGSRWICVSKQFPQYAITEHSAWILHQDKEEGEE